MNTFYIVADRVSGQPVAVFAIRDDAEDYAGFYENYVEVREVELGSAESDVIRSLFFNDPDDPSTNPNERTTP